MIDRSEMLGDRTGFDNLLAHRARDCYYWGWCAKETAIDYVLDEVCEYLESHGKIAFAEAKEILVNKKNHVPVYIASCAFQYHARVVSRAIVPCKFSFGKIAKPEVSYLKLIKGGGC